MVFDGSPDKEIMSFKEAGIICHGLGSEIANEDADHVMERAGDNQTTFDYKIWVNGVMTH